MVAFADTYKSEAPSGLLSFGHGAAVAVEDDGAVADGLLSASTVCSGEQGRATFTGYVADNETGLMYARNRMYSPMLGSFVSRNQYKKSVGWKFMDKKRNSRVSLGVTSRPGPLSEYIDGFSMYTPGMAMIQRTDPTGEPVYWVTRDLAVVPWGNHHFILIIPTDPSKYPDQVMRDFGKGKKGFIIGATKGKKGELSPYSTDGTIDDQNDVTAMKEYYDPTLRPWHHDWDAEPKEITPPTGQTEDELIAALLAKHKKYGEDPDKPDYDTNDENCAAYVNTLLSELGYSEEDRNDLGEHGGTDWGEEDLLPSSMFDGVDSANGNPCP